MKRTISLFLALLLVIPLLTFTANANKVEIKLSDKQIHDKLDDLGFFTKFFNKKERDNFNDAEFIMDWAVSGANFRGYPFNEETWKTTVPASDFRKIIEEDFPVSDELFDDFKALKDWNETTYYDKSTDSFIFGTGGFGGGTDNYRYIGFVKNKDGSIDAYVKYYDAVYSKPQSGDYLIGTCEGELVYYVPTNDYVVYNIISSNGTNLQKNSSRFADSLPEGFVKKTEPKEVNFFIPDFEFVEKLPYSSSYECENAYPNLELAWNVVTELYDYSEYSDGKTPESFTVPTDSVDWKIFDYFMLYQDFTEYKESGYNEDNSEYTFKLHDCSQDEKGYSGVGYVKENDGTYTVYYAVIDLKNDYVAKQGDKEFVDYILKDGEKYAILKDEAVAVNLLHYERGDVSILSWDNISYADIPELDKLIIKPTAGDADGDGVLNSGDAIFVLYFVYFPEDYDVNVKCDFDGDGKIDSADAIYLLYHVYFAESYPLYNKK